MRYDSYESNAYIDAAPGTPPKRFGWDRAQSFTRFRLSDSRPMHG